ncbi:hypothetical protein Hanom_Chr08g00695601 [Helianthus anomalus]
MQNKGFICQLPYQTLTRPRLCNLSIYHLRHFFPSIMVCCSNRRLFCYYFVLSV